MESRFLNTFVSQKYVVPSYAHNGLFANWHGRSRSSSTRCPTCLGRAWFAEHTSPMIRGARGFVYLREMDMPEFRQTARTLRKAAEDL